MTRLSLIALFASAIAPLVAGQADAQTALADLAAPTEAPEPDCNGCYVVADVAGIVFGGVQTITDQIVQSVAKSPNGTNITTITSVRTGVLVTQAQTIEGGQITIDPSPTGSAAPAAAINFNTDGGSTIQVNGATLTSPTQYEVFTAYTVTSFTSDSDGSCVPVAADPSTLESASKYIVSGDAGPSALLGLQQSFISAIGLSCSAGGARARTTVQSRIERTTEQVMTEGIVRPTLVPASTRAADTAAQTGESGASSGFAAPTGTGGAVQSTTVVFGNGTLALPTGSGSYGGAPPLATGGAAERLGAAWLGAAVAACGFVAVLL